MISEAKKAELDAVAAVRVMPVKAPVVPVTLQSLDARLTALEGKLVYAVIDAHIDQSVSQQPANGNVGLLESMTAHTEENHG